jgi:hypothetical protein
MLAVMLLQQAWLVFWNSSLISGSSGRNEKTRKAGEWLAMVQRMG